MSKPNVFDNDKGLKIIRFLIKGRRSQSEILEHLDITETQRPNFKKHNIKPLLKKNVLIEEKNPKDKRFSCYYINYFSFLNNLKLEIKINKSQRIKNLIKKNVILVLGLNVKTLNELINLTLESCFIELLKKSDLNE